MKKLSYILVFLFFACNSEEANDCFQTTGEIIQQEISDLSFDRILVNRGIKLMIQEGQGYKVTIETGEHLINDVTAEVIGNQLVLTDTNTCNFVRDYEPTKVYIEAPNLSEIRTSTQYDISSVGTLSYPNLTLFSENFNGPSEFAMGDFRLSLDSQNLTIVSNNLSFFYLEGMVDELFVGFYSGAGRFEGENLKAQNVTVFHRGSNAMIVKPQQSLSGELKGTGDLISVNVPPVVDVEQFYIGQLIFQ